jgi:hypothetical protein
VAWRPSCHEAGEATFVNIFRRRHSEKHREPFKEVEFQSIACSGKVPTDIFLWMLSQKPFHCFMAKT